MIETLDPAWAPWLMALGIGCLAVGVTGLLSRRVTRFAEDRIAFYEARFVDELQFPQCGPQIIWSLIALLVLLTVALPILLAPGAAIVLLVLIYALAWIGPAAWLTLLRQQRRKKVEAVLPNLLQQLAANFKSNADISLALYEVAETAPAPMDHELRLIRQKETDLRSFPDALDTAAKRLGSDWFDVTAGVLKTTYVNGGKESVALMNLSRVFVQLRTMQERIDTATSQGRMSMKIIMAAPFFAVAAAMIFVPEIAAEAWNSMAGKIMLALAVIVYAVAVAVAIWLSSVKI